jgi:uncharacterized protein (DUF58 family)
MNLQTIKKANLIDGMKKNKFYGIGTEFETLREYSTGDDYRKINWMATARRNKYIVNTYEPEKNQQVYILLDSSRVMNSEINNIKKLDYSINSSLLLADIALKKGDKTGLMVFDSQIRRFVNPGKGTGHFNLLANNLYNVTENIVTADYNNALVYLCNKQKRRTLLCIFTEIFNIDEAKSLVKALSTYARRHVPLLITIKDMRLYENVHAKISEENDIYIKGAALKLIDDREKIMKIFNQAGIATIDVPPDKLSVEVVNKYMTMKATMKF